MRYISLKILVYISFLLLLSAGFKLMDTVVHKKKAADININSAHQDSVTCYFIGSSRVQLGVDEGILKKEIPHVAFKNVGIGALPFNYNIILAHKLLTTKKNNILFVELSAINLFKSWNWIEIFSKDEIKQGISIYLANNQASSLKNFKQFLYDVERFSFCLMRPNPELNRLLFHQFKSVHIGFKRSDNVYKGDDSNIIKTADLLEHKETQPDNLSNYLAEINRLIQAAEKQHSRVVFFLPATFNTEYEKEIDLAVYHSLSDNNKLRYSDSFIHKINTPGYRSDRNHLNYSGAVLFSNQFVHVVKELLLLKTK